jgi:hypothetical protein
MAVAVIVPEPVTDNDPPLPITSACVDVPAVIVEKEAVPADPGPTNSQLPPLQE